MSTQPQAISTEPKLLVLVSILGSAASIIALLIVLLQIAAARIDVTEQRMVWRFFLALAALVGCGGVAMLAISLVRETVQAAVSDKVKAVKVSVIIALALILEAVFLDGFFAALYWFQWLGPVLMPLFYIKPW